LFGGGEALLAGSRELVELGFAGVGGNAPFARQEAVAFETVEGGVERAFFHRQEAGGGPLDMERDAEAMIGTAGKRFQDEQFERWHYPICLG